METSCTGERVVQVRCFEVEGPGDEGVVEGGAEGGRELAHPEHIAEGHGDLARLQVEGHSIDGLGQDLVPDHGRRTQGGMAGEGHLPARREDTDVVTAVALLVRKHERGL